MPIENGFSLPAVSREIRRQYGAVVPYQKIWRTILEHDLPAEKKGRQWYLSPEHLPALAAALKLG